MNLSFTVPKAERIVYCYYYYVEHKTSQRLGAYSIYHKLLPKRSQESYVSKISIIIFISERLTHVHLCMPACLPRLLRLKKNCVSFNVLSFDTFITVMCDHWSFMHICQIIAAVVQAHRSNAFLCFDSNSIFNEQQKRVITTYYSFECIVRSYSAFESIFHFGQMCCWHIIIATNQKRPKERVMKSFIFNLLFIGHWPLNSDKRVFFHRFFLFLLPRFGSFFWYFWLNDLNAMGEWIEWDKLSMKSDVDNTIYSQCCHWLQIHLKHHACITSFCERLVLNRQNVYVGATRSRQLDSVIDKNPFLKRQILIVLFTICVRTFNKWMHFVCSYNIYSFTSSSLQIRSNWNICQNEPF